MIAPSLRLLLAAALLSGTIPAAAVLAQLAPVAPPRTLPAAITRPLVITVRNGRGEIVTGYNVCVGTQQNHQEYGIMFTNDRGEARFEKAPMLGPIFVSVAPAREDDAPIRYAAELDVDAGNRTLDVKLEANWRASCPGIARRRLPDGNPRPAVMGTLRVVGNSIITDRHARLFTARAGDEPYVEVAGHPTQYRTFEEPLGWTRWRPLTVTDGNRARFVTHDIRGGNGTTEIKLQFQRQFGEPSAEYSVRFDFVEIYRCELTIQRADNAMAPTGEPQGNLGKEIVTVMLGTTKTFDTGWPSANEKRRGYGMHLRIAQNTGSHAVELTLRSGLSTETPRIEPGKGIVAQADLASVRCP